LIVGTVVVDLHLPGINSLKEKRRRLKSLQARLRNKFNISVSEVGLNDIKRSAQIGLAMVSNDRVLIEQVFEKAVAIINSEPEMYMADYRVEIL